MERDWLEEELEAGRSIESIAHEVGKDPSTVSYSVNRYGLVSSHRERLASRGGIERRALAELVAEGLSIRAIAHRLERSSATVRHWLCAYGMETGRASRLRSTHESRAAGDEARSASVGCTAPSRTCSTRTTTTAARDAAPRR